MRDIWSFLLQTLTVSGAAALLLAVKAMLRDKLSPRWQFAVWGVLGLMLLIPAGRGGRYALLNWPFVVELLRSAITGEYGALARVTAPVPLLAFTVPQTAEEWIYAIYAAGVVFLLARYVFSYLRLRRALRRGSPAENRRVQAVAERYGLSSCPAVEVEGLSSAFICGVFRPVLALPAGVETDEKVILHELLHLKHHDAAWGLVICFFRCIHWCNPLLWYCADQAGNDLESLCDQRVLERLEGEERRDYGRILLEMADEKYARAPGTSSMANGGKNIRRRIEAIARFKRYPAGMGLVSVCVALVLAVPMVVGARASVGNHGPAGTVATDLAYARTVYCTTYAGAMDTYAKAVLAQRSDYRAMCAPLSEQNRLAESYLNVPVWHWEDVGLSDEELPPPKRANGYQVYNLTQVGEEVYEGLLVVELCDAPEGEEKGVYAWLGVQNIRAEKEGARWVVVPQEEFRAVRGDQRLGGNLGLPAWEYRAEAGDFALEVRRQTVSSVDSYAHSSDWFSSYSSFSTVPVPDGEMTSEYTQSVWAVYTGAPERRERYTHIAIVCKPMWNGEGRPELPQPKRVGDGFESTQGGDSSGSEWCVKPLYWEQESGDRIFLSGGGSSGGEAYGQPDAYALDLYLNEMRAAELTLLPVEGGAEHD